MHGRRTGQTQTLGYGNTVFYTTFGTALNVVMTMIVAYPLSRRDFAGRGLIMFLFTFTMFFQAGLIPTFLLSTLSAAVAVSS